MNLSSISLCLVLVNLERVFDQLSASAGPRIGPILNRHMGSLSSLASLIDLLFREFNLTRAFLNFL